MDMKVANATSVKDIKPLRRHFFRTVVIANNGAVIAEPVWRDKIGDIKGEVQGRELTKRLKRIGAQIVRVFQPEEYANAKQKYYSKVHSVRSETQENLIGQAFDQAGQPHNKRLERFLKTINPMFKEVSYAKTLSAYKHIIKAVAASGALRSADKDVEVSETNGAREEVSEREEVTA